MKIKVINDLGNGKEIKLGFSWTMFFFGLFVPLFRGDFKWFLIMVISSIIFSLVGIVQMAWLIQLGFCFVYNRLYAKDLYNLGFRGMSEEYNRLFVSYI